MKEIIFFSFGSENLSSCEAVVSVDVDVVEGDCVEKLFNDVTSEQTMRRMPDEALQCSPLS